MGYQSTIEQIAQFKKWKQIARMEDYFPVTAIAEYKNEDQLFVLGGESGKLFILTLWP